MFYRFIVLSLSVLLCVVSLAASLPYRELEPGQQFQNKTQGKMEVIEFFSYTCPWCYKLDPLLSKWVQANRDKVHFKRVPVEFQKNWERLAKAYYLADELEKEQVLSAALFKRQQHYGHSKPMPQNEVEAIFVKHGFPKEQFKQAIQLSPTIKAHLGKGRQLAKDLRIYQIPTLIINGRWQTDPQLAGGLQGIIDVLDGMLKKQG